MPGAAFTAAMNSLTDLASTTVGIDGQHVRHVGQRRDRREVGLHVEGQLLVERGVDAVRAGGADHQRVAVGRGLRHVLGGDVAAGAGLVFEHQRVRRGPSPAPPGTCAGRCRCRHPAGKPLTIVIGLAGHCCAPAGVAANDNRAARPTQSTPPKAVFGIEQNLSRPRRRALVPRREPNRSTPLPTPVTKNQTLPQPLRPPPCAFHRCSRAQRPNARHQMSRALQYAKSEGAPPVWRNTTSSSLLQRCARIIAIRPARPLPV